MRRKSIVLGLVATVIAIAGGLMAGAGEPVTLSWDPSPSAGIARYQIYFGTNSGAYSFVTNAGLALTQTVVLPCRGRWYFAATASDTNNVTSIFSNEVEWEIRPEPPVLHGETVVRLTPVLLRSTNLLHWSRMPAEPTLVVATNAAEFYQIDRLAIEPMHRLE
jgi:hypothetical protein